MFHSILPICKHNRYAKLIHHRFIKLWISSMYYSQLDNKFKRISFTHHYNIFISYLPISTMLNISGNFSYRNICFDDYLSALYLWCVWFLLLFSSSFEYLFFIAILVKDPSILLRKVFLCDWYKCYVIHTFYFCPQQRSIKVSMPNSGYQEVWGPLDIIQNVLS